MEETPEQKLVLVTVHFYKGLCFVFPLSDLFLFPLIICTVMSTSFCSGFAPLLHPLP